VTPAQSVISIQSRVRIECGVSAAMNRVCPVSIAVAVVVVKSVPAAVRIVPPLRLSVVERCHCSGCYLGMLAFAKVFV
jgi:hypothetical protein